MNIETQYNNRCASRGLSTMRIVLGMSGKLPVEITNTEVYGIVEVVGKEFPDNDVYIWCNESQFLEVDSNVHYCGDIFNAILDDTKYIIGFAYFEYNGGRGHFVVGHPMALNNQLGLVIAVKER